MKKLIMILLTLVVGSLGYAQKAPQPESTPPAPVEKGHSVEELQAKLEEAKGDLKDAQTRVTALKAALALAEKATLLEIEKGHSARAVLRKVEQERSAEKSAEEKSQP